jgi:hypothetical protein
VSTETSAGCIPEVENAVAHCATALASFHDTPTRGPVCDLKCDL